MSAKPIVVSPATTSAMVMPTLSTTRSTSLEVLGADLLGFGPQDLVGIIDDLHRSASAGGGFRRMRSRCASCRSDLSKRGGGIAPFPRRFPSSPALRLTRDPWAVERRDGRPHSGPKLNSTDCFSVLRVGASDHVSDRADQIYSACVGTSP